MTKGHATYLDKAEDNLSVKGRFSGLSAFFLSYRLAALARTNESLPYFSSGIHHFVQL